MSSAASASSRLSHTGWETLAATPSCSSPSAACRCATRRSTPAGRASIAGPHCARRRAGWRRFVNVSPLRDDLTEGAASGPIRPGSDTALMLALAHVLVDGGLLRPGVPRPLHRRLRDASRYVLASATACRRAPPGPRRSRRSRRTRSSTWRGAWRPPHHDQRRVVAPAGASTASSLTGWASRWPPFSARSDCPAAASASAMAA